MDGFSFVCSKLFSPVFFTIPDILSSPPPPLLHPLSCCRFVITLKKPSKIKQLKSHCRRKRKNNPLADLTHVCNRHYFEWEGGSERIEEKNGALTSLVGENDGYYYNAINVSVLSMTGMNVVSFNMVFDGFNKSTWNQTHSSSSEFSCQCQYWLNC